MDVIHVLLNMTAPFIIILSTIIILPSVLLLKLLLYTYRCAFPENVAGKVALITGASSGIGEYVAYEYAKRGACLVLCARRESKLKNVALAARDFGCPDVLTVRADVSKRDDCKRIIEEAINHFGKLDHLVNNAGITALYDIQSSTDPTYLKYVMDTNYWSSVYTIHFAIPYLKKSRGRIIVISSAGAWFAWPGLCIYNSSKAALISLYETLRIELGSNIGITIVTPGFIKSEMTGGKHLSKEGECVVSEEVLHAVLGRNPQGDVEECGKAIVKSAIRGDKYLTEPSWFLLTYYCSVFFPDVVDLYGRLVPAWRNG